MPKNNKIGIVYLVGAGPGDPGLITVKGLRVLKAAEVVVYDRLVSDELLAEIPQRAKKTYVGKRPGKPSLPQQQINETLIAEGKRGKQIVRLKGGDPFVFGRGGEEALALQQAGIPYEIVPGISSAIAVPAYAGIPLTHRAVATAFSVFTGHEDPTKRTQQKAWRKIAAGHGTLVFLMSVNELSQIVKDICQAGRKVTEACAVIERGTLPGQRVVQGTLGTIVKVVREANIQPPAIVIVGDVTKLHAQLQWFGKPLAGKRVLVTRPSSRALEFTAQLEEAGAEVIQLPAIRLRPIHTNAISQSMGQLQTYDWVLFTSVEGVKHFMHHLTRVKVRADKLRHLKIGAIGPRTAEAVVANKLPLTCTTTKAHQEGLLTALKRYRWPGKRVLIPRALQARMVLPATLESWGAHVDVVPLYEAIPEPNTAKEFKHAVQDTGIDVATFTSSQCVEQFLGALDLVDRRQLLKTAAIASIGPITTATAEEMGMHVAVEAQEATMPSFVDAIVSWAGRS